jgi:hypothetical protein
MIFVHSDELTSGGNVFKAQRGLIVKRENQTKPNYNQWLSCRAFSRMACRLWATTK